MTDKEMATWEKQKAEDLDRYIKSAAWFTEGLKTKFPRLTVGELRHRLAELPDETPVLYQRIEDSYFSTPDNGWETVLLTWEQEDVYSEYIPAFGAHKHLTADGRLVFVVNAHY